MEKHMLVFVYGTLRMGEKNHYLLEGAQRVEENAWTTGLLFDTGNGYPAMVQSEDGQVHGEIYYVDEQQMVKLDELEGYVPNGPDNLYDRILQNIHTKQKDYQAFVYVMKPQTKFPAEIPDGNWKTYRSLQEN